jgi:DNA-binding MarR family transcriptional regulator
MPEQPSRADLLAEVIAEAPRQGASAVRLNIAIAHQLAMPLADVQCMGLLADGPSAPGDLAARLGLTSGAMTKVLDRLERAGYINRAADPSDRRRITIAADPDGLARLAAHYAPMGEKMSRYLDQLSTADLAAVLAFMRAGREAADEEIARIRRQGIRHATRRPRQRRPPGQPAGQPAG